MGRPQGKQNNGNSESLNGSIANKSAIGQPTTGKRRISPKDDFCNTHIFIDTTDDPEKVLHDYENRHNNNINRCHNRGQSKKKPKEEPISDEFIPEAE